MNLGSIDRSNRALSTHSVLTGRSCTPSGPVYSSTSLIAFFVAIVNASPWFLSMCFPRVDDCLYHGFLQNELEKVYRSYLLQWRELTSVIFLLTGFAYERLWRSIAVSYRCTRLRSPGSLPTDTALMRRYQKLKMPGNPCGLSPENWASAPRPYRSFQRQRSKSHHQTRPGFNGAFLCL